jgi:hypothetical protein
MRQALRQCRLYALSDLAKSPRRQKFAASLSDFLTVKAFEALREMEEPSF